MHLTFASSYPATTKMVIRRLNDFMKDKKKMDIFEKYGDFKSQNEAKAALEPLLKRPPTIGGLFKGVESVVYGPDIKVTQKYDGFYGWTPPAGMADHCLINRMLLDQYEFLHKIKRTTPTPMPWAWRHGKVPKTWDGVESSCEQFLEAVLLHEVVHWSDKKGRDGHDKSNDLGHRFERSIYGSKISTGAVVGWMGW